MALKIQYSKQIIKRSSLTGVVPTLGTTQDPTDGSWNNTDIFAGEMFYNIPDKRLWIGGVGEIIELPLSTIFELTYAEALALKDIDGSPVGAGLITGAKYKITDKGDDGLILTAIDVDKFSTYVDELIASPVGIRSAIYDFDADVLSYPNSGTIQTYNISPVNNTTGVTYNIVPTENGNYIVTSVISVEDFSATDIFGVRIDGVDSYTKVTTGGVNISPVMVGFVNITDYTTQTIDVQHFTGSGANYDVTGGTIKYIRL